MTIPPLTPDRTRLLAELRRLLLALEALPPEQGLHGPHEKAVAAGESLAAHIRVNKALVWAFMRDIRVLPGQAGQMRKLEHLEGHLLILDGLTRYLNGILTVERTQPREDEETL